MRLCVKKTYFSTYNSFFNQNFILKQFKISRNVQENQQIGRLSQKFIPTKQGDNSDTTEAY